jgi:hypothetical protein
LDSYSASSLKQQSTGRYDDGRFGGSQEKLDVLD